MILGPRGCRVGQVGFRVQGVWCVRMLTVRGSLPFPEPDDRLPIALLKEHLHMGSSLNLGSF